MKKTFKIAALALFAGLTLASCSENDEPTQKVVTVQKEMIVLNQGNYYKTPIRFKKRSFMSF